MSFFTDTTVQDLVNATVGKVDSLEEDQQKKLLKIFKRVRAELMDRLLTIPEGTFTEQQLNVTLVQVNAAIEAISRDLKGGMVDAGEIMAVQGISDLGREIEKFSKYFEGSVQPINIDQIVRAIDPNSFLINKYQASIDAYAADLRSQITSNIVQSMAMRDTQQRMVSRLVSDIGRFFIGEEWKLNRIVRTEMHNVYNFSKMQGMGEVQESTIPDLKKALMHPMDNRTGDDSKELARINPVVDIDEPFRFKWKGQMRVFQFPPDRPNDRSILVPYREEWGKSAFRKSS
jgi:hypothetical protein